MNGHKELEVRGFACEFSSAEVKKIGGCLALSVAASIIIPFQALFFDVFNISQEPIFQTGLLWSKHSGEVGFLSFVPLSETSMGIL